MDSQKQQNGSNVCMVMVYHVTDTQGRHRFLTMNSFAVDAVGGMDAFEAMLAAQYKTFELMGTNPMLGSDENPEESTSLDLQGAQELGNRISPDFSPDYGIGRVRE